MMKTKNDKIILEIYRRMYKETTPSANINKIIKSGEGKKPNWFMKYNLSQERQLEIIEEVLDKYKIKGYSRKQFKTTILLGSAPSSRLNKIKEKNLEKKLITLKKIKCSQKSKEELREAARNWIKYIKQHISEVHRNGFKLYHLGEIAFIELFFNLKEEKKDVI